MCARHNPEETAGRTARPGQPGAQRRDRPLAVSVLSQERLPRAVRRVEPFRRRRLPGPGDRRPAEARQRHLRLHTHQEPQRQARHQSRGEGRDRAADTLPNYQDRCREVFGGLYFQVERSC